MLLENSIFNAYPYVFEYLCYPVFYILKYSMFCEIKHYFDNNVFLFRALLVA